MEITVCDKSTPRGGSGCFNFIAHLLKPYADKCIVKPVDSDGSELNQVNSHIFFNNMIRHDVWCKIFITEQKFQNELRNIYVLKKIYGDNFEKYTTHCDYDGFFGFKIEIHDIMFNFKEVAKNPNHNIIYVLLQRKCDAIDENPKHLGFFSKLIKDVSPALDLLHENGYAHTDLIGVQNVVSCNGEFKIIDYGRMAHENELHPAFKKIENILLNDIEIIFENPARYFLLHWILPMVTAIVAVGLCTWVCHDLLIIKSKK